MVNIGFSFSYRYDSNDFSIFFIPFLKIFDLLFIFINKTGTKDPSWSSRSLPPGQAALSCFFHSLYPENATQDLLGYCVEIIGCLHHTEELPIKHVARLVTGRATSGPGETTFLHYYSNQNEINEELRNMPDFQFNMFDWDEYQGTAIGEAAAEVLRWAIAALQKEEYSRGDYK